MFQKEKRKQSGRVHTAHFSGFLGGFPSETPLPDRDPSWSETSQEGTWDQAVRQEVTSDRDPTPREQNDRHV